LCLPRPNSLAVSGLVMAMPIALLRLVPCGPNARSVRLARRLLNPSQAPNSVTHQNPLGETTMLTITDLNAESTLDAAAMTNVRGGLSLSDFDSFGIFNTPQIDLGTHLLGQTQQLAVDQSGNIGGVNLVFSDQTQNGIAGQVAI
jgi:hypothetical protein